MHAEERRLDDEAQALGARAADADQKLYSGTVSSPRELQAMQADIDMLKRQRCDLEDRELEVMEQRESLDGEIAHAPRRSATQLARTPRGSQSHDRGAEAEIDAEVAAETAARREAAARHRAGARARLRDGAGRRTAARARRSSSARRARRATSRSRRPKRSGSAGPAGDVVAYCDNCGAILVP